MNKDPGHIKRIKHVSYKLNIPEEVIELALHYTSEYIKNKIAEVELDKEVMISKEEFENRFPIIHIPYMGYLKPSYYKYKHIFEKSKLKRERLNNNNINE